jgi:arylformamidase
MLPRVIDLTKPLDASSRPYAHGDYSDPSFKVSEWSSVEREGFRVSHLALGTQTGTHIDAPAHFEKEGKTLELLPPASLMGRYFLVELSSESSLDSLSKALESFKGEEILFVRTAGCRSIEVDQSMLDRLLLVPAPLWVLGGEITIRDAQELEFHRVLARAGKFLVEELLTSAVDEVPNQGELIALPLRLIGTSGSPCRVIVRV